MRAVSGTVSKTGQEHLPAAVTLLFLNLLIFLAFLNTPALLYKNDGSAAWWTFYTSHFAHWDLTHYVFNAVCFNLLAVVLFLRCGKLLLFLLLSVPWLLTLSFYCLSSHQFNYCGLSGLVTAMFAALGTWMFLRAEYRIPGALLIILLSLKIAAENIFSVSPLSYNGSFTVFSPAHSSGAALGIFITVIFRKKL